MKPLLRSELIPGGVYLCLLSGKYMIALVRNDWCRLTNRSIELWEGYYYGEGFQKCDIFDNQLVAPNFTNKE